MNGALYLQSYYLKRVQNGKVSTSNAPTKDMLLIFVLEKKLEAHDLAIPLPQGGLGDRSQLFRIILLSSEDMKDMTKVMARIERLYNYTGGQYVGIFFLLEDVNTTPENGLRAFMTLQAEYVYNYCHAQRY